MAKIKRSTRNIRWIEEHCYIPEGKFVGKKVKLAKFQKDVLKDIYDNPHGTRRHILSMGRKNAKTTLSAFILLLHLVGPEAKPNSQLFSAAQSRDQAAILFGLAAKIVRISPTLTPFVGIRDTAKQLYCEQLGTLYRALSADASTAYGLSPVLVVHDELGQVKGPFSELYEALESASAGQEQPLSIIISTQAPTDADLLSVLIDDIQKGEDPKQTVTLHSAPEDADPFSDEAIKAANPAFDYFMNRDEVRAMARDAQRLSVKEASYRNLILNQRVEASSPFVTRTVWSACNAEPGDWDGLPVYGGLDLSSVHDLTALVLTANEGGVWGVRPTFWLPEKGLAEKSRSDRVPYDVWAKNGLLETTPGPAIEYEWIAHRLRAVFDRHDIRAIAFDRWGWKYLRPWLEKAGFSEDELERFVEFGQGFASMSPALRDLETVILQSKLAHGDHAILNTCMFNAVVQSDPAGNRKFNKGKSSGRIDGAVALAMAVAAGVSDEPEADAPTPWDLDPDYSIAL